MHRISAYRPSIPAAWKAPPTRMPARTLDELRGDRAHVLLRPARRLQDLWAPSACLESAGHGHNHGGVAVPPPDLDEAITLGTQLLPKNARLIRIGGLSFAGLVTVHAIREIAEELWHAPAALAAAGAIETAASDLAAREAEILAQQTQQASGGRRPGLHKLWRAASRVVRGQRREKMADVVEKSILLVASTGMLAVILAEIPQLASLGALGLPVAIPGIALFGILTLGHAAWKYWTADKDAEHIAGVFNRADVNYQADLKTALSRVNCEKEHQTALAACGLALMGGVISGPVGISLLVCGSVGVGLAAFSRSLRLPTGHPSVPSGHAVARFGGPLLVKRFIASAFVAKQREADLLAASRPAAVDTVRTMKVMWRRLCNAHSERPAAVRSEVWYLIDSILETRIRHGLQLRTQIERKIHKHGLRTFNGYYADVLTAVEDQTRTAQNILAACADVRGTPAEATRLAEAVQYLGVFQEWGAQVANTPAIRTHMHLQEGDGMQAFGLEDIEGLQQLALTDRANVYDALYRCTREVLWRDVAPREAMQAGKLFDLLAARLKDNEKVAG